MKLVRYRVKKRPRLGYLKSGHLFDLKAVLEYFAIDKAQQESVLASPLEIIASDPEMLALIQTASNKGSAVEAIPEFTVPSHTIHYLAPVTNPGKVICVGLNYLPPEDIDPAKLPEYPVLFHKVASALTGHQQPIRLPKISQEVEYEGELAIVIGKRARQIKPGSVKEHIAGFTIANDVGARDVQRRSSQWTSGKMFDTFCPLGPALVTTDEIARPNNLHIRTRLNEEVVQDSSTGQMIFKVEDLVSYITELTTLLPGDIILTGSPKNRGDQPDPRRLLCSGDSIEINIESLGTLLNPVVAEE